MVIRWRRMRVCSRYFLQRQNYNSCQVVRWRCTPYKQRNKETVLARKLTTKSTVIYHNTSPSSGNEATSSCNHTRIRKTKHPRPSPWQIGPPRLVYWRIPPQMIRDRVKWMERVKTILQNNSLVIPHSSKPHQPSWNRKQHS